MAKSSALNDIKELFSSLILIIILCWFFYNGFVTDNFDKWGGAIADTIGIREELNSLEIYLRQKGIMNT